MKKVLILSAPIGNGHKMSAMALQENLNNRKDVELYEGDIFSFMPDWIGKCFLYCYLKVLKYLPWVYALAYKNGSVEETEDLEREQKNIWLRTIINRSFLKMGEAYLERIQPEIVIATHATALGIVSLYKEKHPEISLYGVVPDYTIHPWWLYKNIDCYYLADKLLVKRFPEGSQVKAFGIPLREAFTKFSKEAAREELGISSNETLILIMGGGDGLLPMKKIIEAILKNKLQGIRLMTVTGNNRALELELKQRFNQEPTEKLQIFGYRQDAPKLLQAADVLISKGGAVTAAEALACSMEYIIYQPLPGQEQGNAKFLAQNYDVKVANSIEEIVLYISNLAGKQFSIREENIGVLTENKLSTQKICEDILVKNTRIL